MTDTTTSPGEQGLCGAAGISFRKALLLIAAYAAAVYLPFLGSGRTLTRHEVIVTLPALHMLREGHWLVPQYAGQMWVDKPPLISWLTALSFALFGVSEFAARLPAALSAIGLCVLVAVVARRFLGTSAALWAGGIQATSVYMFMQGRLGEIDMPLTLILAGAHSVLLWHWGSGRTDLPLSAAAAFHVLAGLGLLAKGPVTAALLGSAILLFCALRRSVRPLASLVATPAALLFPVVGLSWYVAVWGTVGSPAWDRWYYTNVDRFAGAHVQGTQSPLVYLAAIPWMTLPGCIPLVIRARRVLAEARQPDNHFQRYLWAWFLGGLVVLFASAMKHKHYCIPVLPPLSLLAAKVIVEDLPRYPARLRRLVLPGFAAALVPFALVGGVAIPRQDRQAPTIDFVREASARVPPEETLHVVGLAQSAAYAYIKCRWRGYNSLGPFQQTIEQAGTRPLWVLTQSRHLAAARSMALQWEIVARERPRPRWPESETLVLCRVRRSAAASASAATRGYP